MSSRRQDDTVSKEYSSGHGRSKAWFPFTANVTTKTQKQSDYIVEQSSFPLIALFDMKLVVVVVVIGLLETRLKEVPLFAIVTRNICLKLFPLSSCHYVNTIPEKTVCYRPFKYGHFVRVCIRGVGAILMLKGPRLRVGFKNFQLGVWGTL